MIVNYLDFFNFKIKNKCSITDKFEVLFFRLIFKKQARLSQ